MESVSINRISTLNFTDDQRKAYNGLIEFIDSAYNPNDYKRALIGAAGTGKTYLVKALISNSKVSNSMIGLATPTHKACRILAQSINISGIKVNTLASDMGLKPNFNSDAFDVNNPPFDPFGVVKVGDYKVYILDEASMVPRGMCMLLEKIARENKCKILYIGDSSQLPPPKESYAAAFKGIKTFNLKQIVRQDDNNPVKYLLDLLRFDIENKTLNFLQYISRNKFAVNNKDEGYQVCNTAEFNQVVSTTFTNEELTTNVDFCKLVAYTNLCVSGWNKAIRNYIITDADKSVITKHDLLISYITIVNKFNETVLRDSDEYIIYDIVNYTHPQYELKGFLVRFTAIHGGKTTPPIFILDHKDSFSVHRFVQITETMIRDAKVASKHTRGARWREYYEFRDSCLILADILAPDGKTIKYKRTLDYGFALTAHKSQGSTFNNVLVDVDDIVFDKNGSIYNDIEQINRRLYVACSRCKNRLTLKWNK